MKEVRLKRVVGPFNKIPFNNYIQSLVGLVPKGENQTRLIFHLSYTFNKGMPEEEQSVNYHTPDHLCSVRYEDLDHAMCTCLRVRALKLGQWQIYFCKDQEGNDYVYLGKSDIKFAFRCCLLTDTARNGWFLKQLALKVIRYNFLWRNVCHSVQALVVRIFNNF